MSDSDEKLQELIKAVQEISPQLANSWQATAIIESLGYTDRIIKAEFGFDNARDMGQYIYESLSKSPVPPKPPKKVKFWKNIFDEIRTFIDEFSQSFVYAIPLILMLIMEYLDIGEKKDLLPPQLASLFTIVTVASLTTTGGFVQMISRRGRFYIALGEIRQAQRVSASLLYLGSITTIFLGFLGLWFNFYRSLFADQYIVIAIFYYVILSILWMLLAVLSIQLRWNGPLVLIGLSVFFVFLRLQLGLGTLVAQIWAMFVSLLVVIALVLFWFIKYRNADSDSPVKLPRLSAVVYLMSPYFGYGLAYFSFIFADRIVAGLAINPASGLLFAIDSNYQKGMDLALLNFLLLVPLVEYLGYIFIRYWYSKAKILTVDNLVKFSSNLYSRYGLALISTVIFFGLSVFLTVGILKPDDWERQETILALLGCLGYLFFVIGLFNGLILFSLNQGVAVCRILIIALIVNLTVGYIFANTLSVFWASLGLIFGGFCFMILSARKVVHSIKKPDYAYYIGGY
ncbi:MAG: hypothetical protein WBB43_09010 [Limnoraphis sp.]